METEVPGEKLKMSSLFSLIGDKDSKSQNIARTKAHQTSNVSSDSTTLDDPGPQETNKLVEIPRHQGFTRAMKQSNKTHG